MSYYPNQKQITINRELVKKNTPRFFLCAYQDNLSEAMKNLSHTGFKVYLALMFNRDKYAIEFSPKYVSQITGMCLDTARKGLKELESKFYLLPSNETKTMYQFYETPHEEGITKRIYDFNSGRFMNLTYQETMSKYGYVEGIRLWTEE